MTPELYYFGCGREPGHHLWEPGRDRMRRFREAVPGELPGPWDWCDLDGGLCPDRQGRHPQGVARLHHCGGWTALAFWDRSVDRRPGSCSVFLASGTWSFEEMLGWCSRGFPQVFDRLRVPLRTEAEWAALRPGLDGDERPGAAGE